MRPHSVLNMADARHVESDEPDRSACGHQATPRYRIYQPGRQVRHRPERSAIRQWPMSMLFVCIAAVISTRQMSISGITPRKVDEARLRTFKMRCARHREAALVGGRRLWGETHASTCADLRRAPNLAGSAIVSGRTPSAGFPALMAAAEDLLPLVDEDAAEAERISRQTDRVVAALRETASTRCCCRARWAGCSPGWTTTHTCTMSSHCKSLIAQSHRSG